MKYFIILFMLIISTYSYTQTIQEITVKYSDFNTLKIKPVGKCVTYISKDTISYNIGEEIKIGLPGGNNNNFVHIFKKDTYITTEILDKTGIIKNISIVGSNQEGWEITIRVMIDNMIYTVDIEQAIETGEIIK